MLHEDLEFHEKQGVLDSLEPPKNARQRIVQDRVFRDHVDKYFESAKKLLQVYDDKDGLRSAELNAIGGASAAVYTVFLDRLREIRQHHALHPNRVIDVSVDKGAGQKADPFTGEEHHGKYLDMHAFHERATNMTALGFERVDYMHFVGFFHRLDRIPKERKLGAQSKIYRSYLDDMLEYLLSFHARTNPLVNQEKMLRLIEADFSERWEQQKEVPGWIAAEKKEAGRGGGKVSAVDSLDDDEPAAAPELSAPVPEPPKEEVQVKLEPVDKPFHCAACSQSFAKETVFQSHVGSAKHKKRLAQQQQQGGDAAREAQRELAKKKRELLSRELALSEAKLFAMGEYVLRDTIITTQARVEQKQTLTYQELEAEMHEEAEAAAAPAIVDESDDEDEEKAIYNPHNVPLGWDGKPIPYWLYKLHGLNIEYKCEICGNFSYWGPRAFQRHFTEARHSYGMKCLGIPNTKHFLNITAIADAMELHERVKKLSNELAFRPDEEEEFEDDEGNVFNKKTYLDLRRQGLV